MNSFEKNKLDLEYTNLLNWRSILFGSYFALLAIIGARLSVLFQGELTIFFSSMVFFSFLLWVTFDHLKYKEIKFRLGTIEKEIESMKQ